MFPIQVTLTITTLTDLMKVQSIVASTTPASDPAKAKYETADEALKGVAAKKAADKAAVKSEPTKVEEKAEASDPEAKVYTLEEARAFTTKLVGAGKRDEAVALLEKHEAGANDKGTRVAAKLPEENVQAFCAEAEAILAA